MVMEEVSETQEKQLTPAMAEVVLQSKDQETVEKEKHSNNVVSVESVEKQEQKMEEKDVSKPALDVSSIKLDILKALADARSTRAPPQSTGSVDKAAINTE
ncbi:Serine/threonine protein Kinase, partial [Phytophthora palmivora]